MHELLTKYMKAEEELHEVQLFIELLQVMHWITQGVQIPLKGAKVPPEGHEDWHDPL